MVEWKRIYSESVWAPHFGLHFLGFSRNLVHLEETGEFTATLVWIIAGRETKEFSLPIIVISGYIIKEKNVGVQNQSRMIQSPFGIEWQEKILSTQTWCKLYLF